MDGRAANLEDHVLVLSALGSSEPGVHGGATAHFVVGDRIAKSIAQVQVERDRFARCAVSRPPHQQLGIPSNILAWLNLHGERAAADVHARQHHLDEVHAANGDVVKSEVSPAANQVRRVIQLGLYSFVERTA